MRGLRSIDVGRGAQFLGQSWLKDGLIQINTANALNGWAEW